MMGYAVRQSQSLRQRCEGSQKPPAELTASHFFGTCSACGRIMPLRGHGRRVWTHRRLEAPHA